MEGPLREDGEDQLFERWCRRADAAALEALFGRTAPRLLRLAVHLVGDAAEAEDLVQATFAALIEQRASVDGERPAWPWLSGVLAHKAGDARRRRARSPDPGRLIERLAEDPSALPERRELDGEIARAVDALPEPYRQVVLLRVRHGLAAADIAHVIGREPATVRVQLHRGLARLRSRLPASLAGLLAFPLDAPRGLAAVRAELMRQAAAAGTAASATPLAATLTGAILVKPKLLAAVAVALAVLLASIWPRDVDVPAGVVLTTSDPALRTDRDAPTEPLGTATGRESLLTQAQAEGPSSLPSGAVAMLWGRVFDGDTGDPLPGAEVRLFAARSSSVREAARGLPHLYEVQGHGELRPRTQADWPRIEGDTAAVRFGMGSVRLYDLPEPGAEPLATTRADGEGRFRLPAGAAGGLLVATCEGYALRARAALDPSREWALSLWRERGLSGRVVTPDGEPPGVGLELALAAIELPAPVALVAQEGSGTRVVPPERIEGLGAWRASCGTEGDFSCSVAGRTVTVSVITPGWEARPASPAPVGAGLRVVVEPTCLLRFLDAATGLPVERVRLLARERANGHVRLAGAFEAPDGLLELAGSLVRARSRHEGATALTAWAAGHGSAEVELAGLEPGAVHEVRLEAGAVPSLGGAVRRGAMPVAGAVVALVAHSPLRWRADDDAFADAGRTDAGGRYLLSAAAGRYLLRVDDGATSYQELVDLPAGAPLDIDLDALGHLDVQVVDGQGIPRALHQVAYGATDGRGALLHADEQGRLALEHLPPQRYTLMAPFVPGDDAAAFVADVRLDVELERGERRAIQLLVPRVEGPRHLRVVARGIRSYGGWRARLAGEDWEPLEADGTMRQDLTLAGRVLEVEAPDRRRWSAIVPRGAKDGDTLVLDDGPGSYRGVLLGPDGAPRVGWRLHAAPQLDSEEGAVVASVVTDGAGRFALEGLGAGEHLLLPLAREEGPFDFTAGTLQFRPDALASEGAELVVRLPEVAGEALLRGVVRSAVDGQPLREHLVAVRVQQRASGGVFLLRSPRRPSVAHTDAQGRFELQVPQVERVRLQVWRAWEEGGLVLERELELMPEQPVELLVPE